MYQDRNNEVIEKHEFDADLTKCPLWFNKMSLSWKTLKWKEKKSSVSSNMEKLIKQKIDSKWKPLVMIMDRKQTNPKVSASNWRAWPK